MSTPTPLSDLDIARQAGLRPIAEVAAAAGLDPERLEPYGRHVAKVPLDAGRSDITGMRSGLTPVTECSVRAV